MFVSSFVSLLLPVMLLSRLLSRIRPKEYSLLDEWNVPPVANKLFELVLNFEQFLISAGVRFPMGGSLIVAARKKSQLG